MSIPQTNELRKYSDKEIEFRSFRRSSISAQDIGGSLISERRTVRAWPSRRTGPDTPNMRTLFGGSHDAVVGKEDASAYAISLSPTRTRARVGEL